MSEIDKGSNWNTWIAIAAVMIAATWLRLHGIADKSFWTDEGVSAAFTKLDWFDFGRILWRREGNMALYYLLLRAWSHFGDSVAMLRAFSAVWSVATVPVLYLVGKRLFGEWTGVSAALLWSVNAYSVRYAQEVRSYSMVAFLVTLASYFLIVAVQDDSKRDWKAYIIVSALGIYAHFFAVLVVVAQALTLWKSHVHPEVIRAVKRIVLFTLPAWIFIATTGIGPISWIPRPNVHEMWTIFGDYVGHGGLPLTLLYIAGMVLAAIAALRSKMRQAYVLAFAWFLVPIVITFVVSQAKPVLMPRYLIVSVPALVMLVAAGIASLPSRWLATPLLTGICWLALGGVRGYYDRDFDLYREDFRSATKYILDHAEPGDAIVFHKGQNRFAYSYYADHANNTLARPLIIYPGGDQPAWHDFASKVAPQTLDTIRQQRGRVWLLISENMGPNGEDEAAQELKQVAASTHRLQAVDGFQMLRAYLYDNRH